MPVSPALSPVGRLRSQASDLVALTKPRLSSLVLFTAGGGLALSGAQVSIDLAITTMLGTCLVVAAANTLNCYIEREGDLHMGRTRTRPLPAGRLRPTTALVFGVALSLISVPMLAWLTTPLAGLLAAVALLSYVLVYTPLKRVSSLHTLVGAIPGAMPPLIGWTAATGTIEVGGLVLFAIMFLWQIPHSLAITIYRQTEYDAAGIVVLPTEHGLAATRRQSFVYAVPLVPLTALLYTLDVAGPVTLTIGSALGGMFTWKAFEGLRNAGDAKWARQLFVLSLIYLTGLFAVLAVDALW